MSKSAVQASGNLAPETLYTDKSKISCDGAGGALGHPRVYLAMNSDEQVECPYCDRLFILEGGKSDRR